MQLREDGCVLVYHWYMRVLIESLLRTRLLIYRREKLSESVIRWANAIIY